MKYNLHLFSNKINYSFQKITTFFSFRDLEKRKQNLIFGNCYLNIIFNFYLTTTDLSHALSVKNLHFGSTSWHV